MKQSFSHAKHSCDTSRRMTASDRFFQSFARSSARATGHSLAFGLALGLLLLWVATGPFFHFSDTWQLVINTATSVATFLMVFVIQNTQNRDSEALQLKLDELIRVNRRAHNALLDIEELTEQELDQIKADYERLAADARDSGRHGKKPAHPLAPASPEFSSNTTTTRR